MPRFSIIIPLFNRPAEIDELLRSITMQSECDFQVIIVEDGSTIPSRDVVDRYAEQISIQYLVKDNSGPALSRNYGAQMASGEWLIFLDSDCVVPPDYLKNVAANIQNADCFGGPDRADENFSTIQKAINYSMTSFFTTGGIRGGAKSMEKFHPRSFNMGVRRDVFQAVGGFSAMRFGEDVDLSMRLFEAGYSCKLIPSAWVYHKRRVDFCKFYRQVKASGGARITLARKHKGSLKIVHLLPAAFLVFFVLSFVGVCFCWYAILPLALYITMVVVDCGIRTGSVKVAIFAKVATIIQLCGYGIGFFGALFGSNPEKIQNRKFYK